VQVFLFNIANSRLRRYSSGVIYGGTHPNTVFKFNFNTTDWNASPSKTAVFSYRGSNYREDIDENNLCRVPEEVLYEGYFLMSVEGSNGLLTNNVRVPVAENPNPGTNPDPEDKPDSNEVNIFDGGTIISDLPDNPDDPDEPDVPDIPDTPSTPEENGIVDYISENKIPIYVGLAGEEASEVTYKQLNTSTSNYTDQGFYITTNNDGQVTNAGYQLTFKENDESIAQTFSMCADAKIVTAYQYHPTFNQWTDVGFDGTYWVEDGTITITINGQQVIYTTYVYNVELMGDAITSPEYWRFEVEVL
jgi:hypothetical protein